MKMRRSYTMLLATVALAASFTSAQAGVMTVDNGSFEVPVSGAQQEGGHYSMYTTESQGLTGWTVSGSVDIVDYLIPTQSYAWAPSDGSQSLDLNGDNTGSISQEISGLTVGRDYNLSFDYANNPYNGGSPSAIVSIGGVSAAITHSGSTPSNMNWISALLTFKATSATALLSFVSQTSGSGGIALDNIAIAAVPEPSTIALFSCGAIAMVVGRIRKKKTVVA